MQPMWQVQPVVVVEEEALAEVLLLWLLVNF